MHVILADPAITVTGWTPDLDKLGAYTLKVRKTLEELKAEKQRRRDLYGPDARPPNPMKLFDKSMIYHVQDSADTVRFFPGLWPRIKAYFDENKLQYDIEDQRNPDIRPPIDYGQLTGVQFRENQDLALALIANADCGVIETATAWGKSFLISVICKALPTLNILVCTSSSTVVATLYEYLCKQLPGQVGYVYAKGNTSQGKRVVLSTLRSLPKISEEHVQMVLIDEC